MPFSRESQKHGDYRTTLENSCSCVSAGGLSHRLAAGQCRKVYHSNTTSPDSGASLSPGLEVIDGHRDGHHFLPRAGGMAGAGPPGWRISLESMKGACMRGWEQGYWGPPPHPPPPQAPQSPHLKPRPGPLQLHPPPRSHAHPAARMRPPPSSSSSSNSSSRHLSAFSPPRPSYSRSWSLSTLPQQQQKEQQWSPMHHSVPATPLTGSDATPTVPMAFTMPDHAASRQDHAHTQQWGKQPEFHRSMNLSHHTSSMPRPPLPSQDDLLTFEEPRQYPPSIHYSKRKTTPPSHVGGDYKYSTLPRQDATEQVSPPYSAPSHMSHPPPVPTPSSSAPSSLPPSKAVVQNCRVYDNLTSVDMLEMLLNIGSPNCNIHKLE